jgi:hypothetical protein
MSFGCTARSFALILSLAALASTLSAQVDTGTILGTIRDNTGALIPGATVTVKNEGTSFSQSTTTNSSGTYAFTALKIGRYTVQAENAGFTKAVHTGLQLNIQQQLVVDFDLVLGQVTNQIEVTGQAPILQTENGSVGQVIEQREVNNLPLNGRNYTFLARLVPGATVGQPEGRGLNAPGWFSANGTRPAHTNDMLDGSDNTTNDVDFLSGAAYVIKPPVDAISEFRLQTSTFSAEFGRAGGAVLNASIKSGTNQLHGTLWEFLRNDKLDAADFFQNANSQPKGSFKQNQFGAAAGGPIIKNRLFFFADYEGTRIRQGVPKTGYTVPTLAERNSGYTDFSDLITLQKGSQTDALGNSYPLGTIFDPSTTRSLGGGQYVRTPFPGNIIPVSRLNPNAMKLLDLLPAPTQAGLNSNFNINRNSFSDVNQFDVRLDANISSNDSIFGRVSWSQNPSFSPGPFTGYADGGAFGDGNQAVDTSGAALSYTHSFSPSLVNEARVGFTREHTIRQSEYGNDTSNIPAQFGIQGIPQIPGNGGLPYFGIGGLSQPLGSAEWLISDRFSNTLQFTENLNKVYHSHTFKGGFEAQSVYFPWTAPPYGRGEFNFNGQYTSVVNKTDGSTGRAQFLLNPTAVSGLNGTLLGGASSVNASNFGGVASQRSYYGAYFQDDWKVTSKLTLNLGLRWDWFGATGERYGAQANFVPGPPGAGAQYLIPANRNNDPTLSPSFTQLLAKDGIALTYTDAYGSGLSIVPKNNFAPRFGFAYQLAPRLVVRGGYGIFFGAFENRGGSPSLGYNYPFQYIFSFPAANSVSPTVYPNGTIATIENGLSSVPLNATAVNASGLSLRAIQFRYKTPYVQNYNFTLEYQLSNSDVFSAGYVASLSRNLEAFVGTNLQSVLLPPGTDPLKYVPFPDFARGSSYASTIGTANYHALQTKYQHSFTKGLTTLVSYTYSKALTDAGDLLSNGSLAGFRATNIPGVGAQYDYGLAAFDIRHAFTASGTYDLPFGRDRKYVIGNRYGELLLGGWSTNFILTLDDGQPQTINCATPTGAGTGCYALYTGVSPYSGQHNVQQFYNPAAFATPAAVTQVGQSDISPLGGGPAQVTGPPIRRLDFSVFKQFPITESTRVEFRAESFNLTNTPSFGQPGSLGYLNTANFARITSTRDAPNGARELQFALKLYW